MKVKNKYFNVDGYLTYQGKPAFWFLDPQGRRHCLTIDQVRGLMSDIQSELERLDSERNERDDNASGSN